MSKVTGTACRGRETDPPAFRDIDLSIFCQLPLMSQQAGFPLARARAGPPAGKYPKIERYTIETLSGRWEWLRHALKDLGSFDGVLLVAGPIFQSLPQYGWTLHDPDKTAVQNNAYFHVSGTRHDWRVPGHGRNKVSSPG